MGDSSPSFKGVGNTLQIIILQKTHLIAVHIQLVR